MNRFNERPGMYVQGTPPNAKQQDQNTAAVGPTRVNVDEQVRQVIDTKPTIDFTLPQTGLNYGTFAPGYWYTSDHVGKNVTNSLPHAAGYIFPITIPETSVIDAFGISVTDNLAGGVGNYADYYYARIGIYAEVDGVPLTKVTETAEFNYGNGSMTNAAFNVLTLSSTTVLPAGKYWILFMRSSNNNLANPAYVRFRNNAATTGGKAFPGPMDATAIYANGYSMCGYTYQNVNSAGGTATVPWSTVLPTQLDFWNEIIGPVQYAPDIWLRGA